MRFISLNLIPRLYCLNKNMEVSCMNKSIIDKEILGYIEKCILDTARKCNTTNEKVIQTFKKHYNNE